MRRLILFLPLVLSACATTGSDGGAISIETVSRGQPVVGASCSVSTNGASWNVVTPAIVAVGDANGDLRVLCNKAGYRASEMIFRPSGPLGSSVGLGVGGGGSHVGVGVGLSVPVAIGRGGYPSRVAIELTPQ